MIREWSALKSYSQSNCLQLIRQRESIYTLLAQTTPNNLQSNFTKYSLDPRTRYVHLNLMAIPDTVVRTLYDNGTDTTDQPKKLPKSPSQIG